ncbi:MAG: 16S rRNA (guanine(966)-N(2))-methyltransferase RsmD [Ruminococcaceae bacterium]|jgi:16S rRNA (guanine(966)-N(2))-methyltransferase RsmD|nr:16S rRNA (guanine(966)-N(2))-methyltransferase RsmD [Oscillospiraceae bacterium]
MRVITGSARGMRLFTLEGDSVRPTTDKVKEAMFSIIQFEIEGRRVLDLFAGSGQLGIEALSRGAKSAQFVDESKQAISVINKNLEKTKLKDLSLVSHTDSVAFISSTDRVYDLFFLDPPYNKGLIEKVLPLCEKRAAAGALIVCETSAEEFLPEEIEGLVFSKRYKYGKTALTVYRKAEA